MELTSDIRSELVDKPSNLGMSGRDLKHLTGMSDLAKLNPICHTNNSNYL